MALQKAIISWRGNHILIRKQQTLLWTKSKLLALAVLFSPSLVLGPSVSPGSFSMGDSDQEGFSVNYSACGSSPLKGLAVETILTAGAPSTRKRYALRWRLGPQCHLGPVHCSVGPAQDFIFIFEAPVTSLCGRYFGLQHSH